MMNFFLPGFFDYLQNQPSLCVVAQSLEYADAETASISTMLLTILFLLSTVEGVVLFFTTLYSWCFFPLHNHHHVGGDDDDDDEEEEAHWRRSRRHRRIALHAGEYHWLWWLDVDYDASDDDDEEEYDSSGSEDDDHDSHDGDGLYQKMTRTNRIQLSLQEQTFYHTQFEDCCAICLVDFQRNDRVVSGIRSCCRNCFHRDCLEHWLKIQSSCPCCRSNLILRSKELQSKQQKQLDTAAAEHLHHQIEDNTMTSNIPYHTVQRRMPHLPGLQRLFQNSPSQVHGINSGF